ncbi:MAG: T9SS type A sorting domain-containing protein [Draconibacterium sp.]
MQNSLGCDSTIVLDLTVNPTDESNIYVSIAQGQSYTFAGNSYTETGVYTDSLVNSLGCDSLVILHLEVTDNQAPYVANPVENIQLEVGHKQTETIDMNEVFSDDEDLSYNYGFEGLDSTNWLSSSLEGGLLTIYFEPTIADTGCFNLILEALDPLLQKASDSVQVCVKNYTGIGTDKVAGISMKIYPNPTNGISTLEFETILNNDVEILVMDINGRRISHNKYLAPVERIKIDLSGLTSSTYLISIKTKETVITKRIILNRMK